MNDKKNWWVKKSKYGDIEISVRIPYNYLAKVMEVPVKKKEKFHASDER